MTTLHIDFETRSTVDLRKTGVDVYAADPTTDVWCMAWAVDEGPVEIITEFDLRRGWIEMPAPLADALYGGEATIVAHNAPFEIAIWNRILADRYGWPPLDPRRVECTMAMALALSIPASLDDAAKALKLPIEKDKQGQGLMLRMAKPRRIEADGTIIWWEDPERLEKLHAYCIQDVEVERALHKRLVRLPAFEREVWLLDWKINNRGVPIDMRAVDALQRLDHDSRRELNLEARERSGGRLISVNSPSQLADWINWRMADQNDGQPVVGSMDKDAVSALLERDDLPADVRRVAEIRQLLARSSTKKLEAMRQSVNADNRARGLHQYHGASTGRWAGRRIQTQNMPRPVLDGDTIDKAVEVISATVVHYWDVRQGIRHIEALWGEPIHVVADCLRSCIAAPEGRTLMQADYSNIEGRVLAWLAGQQDKLDAFAAFDAGEGPDLYKVTAGAILGKPAADVTKDERQAIGKVAELAFGYQGGVGAWRNFKDGNTDEEINTFKDGWRRANHKIVDLWYALERAAMDAVRNPGGMYEAGRIRFKMSGTFLFCQLPSRRCLSYPFPSVRQKMMPWGEERPALFFYGQDTYTRKWGHTDTYGGKLAENVTQAVARDILAEAMVRLDQHGYEIVMHVHDEIVVETDGPRALHRFPHFKQIMSDLPEWAEGLPIAVDGWVGRRYRK